MKLILVNAIAYPVETHVDSFGALLFDMIICNPYCGGVIHLNGSGGAEGAPFLSVLFVG